MSVAATDTVKTKTISDMRLYDDPGYLPMAYTFVADGIETPSALKRARIDDIYKSFEYQYAPTYEQSYCNVSLAGRKLYYPTICQDNCDDIIKWRVMFLNQKGRTAATKFYVKDQSGATLSAQMLDLSDGYEYTTLDWLAPVDGYLSVNNAAADVDVLLRGYVGGYPDVKARTFASADIEDIGDAYRWARSVGAYAFAYSGLTAANLPMVEAIESGAFGYTNISSVDFPNAIFVGNSVFFGCSALTAANLPNATTFGNTVFSGCKSLVSVSLPAAESVGHGMFRNLTSLERVDMPRASWSLEEAIAGPERGQQMFYTNRQLTAVSLSAVGCFPQQIFYRCENLQNVGCDWNAVRLIDTGAFYGCKNLAYLGSMPNVVSVDGQAFYNCSKLSSISLPGCLSVGAAAFDTCTALVSVDMEQLQLATGASVFDACKNLLSANFPNLKRTGSAMFRSCKALRYVDIHSADMLTSIPSNTFNGCSNLSVLKLPPLDGTIKSIGAQAFYSCNRLSDLISWNGVLSVLSCAFQQSCTGKAGSPYYYLRNQMAFPDARYFAPSAFYQSTVNDLTCWEVSSIGKDAFTESNLRRIHFDNSANKVPTVDSTSFNNITYTVEVYVPESMYNSFKSNTTWKALTTAKTYNGESDTEGHVKIELISYY